MDQKSYPVTVKGELSHPPSPALWLIKWILLIPHYVILFFLWIAYFFVTFIAFFAILFTGRYPRGLFQFNVGVMRWTWRVGFYGYNALGTDKYPPFTLKSEDYPADLTVDYPEKLSSGLVLIKWWILAVPHYIVVGGFSTAVLDSLTLVWGRFWRCSVQSPGCFPIDILRISLSLLWESTGGAIEWPHMQAS